MAGRKMDVNAEEFDRLASVFGPTSAPATTQADSPEMADFLKQAALSGVDPVAASQAFESGDPARINALAKQVEDFGKRPQAQDSVIRTVEPNDALFEVSQAIAVTPDSPPLSTDTSTTAKPTGRTSANVFSAVAERNAASPVINPFKVEGEIVKRGAKVEESVRQLGEGAQEFQTRMADIAAKRRAQNTAVVGELDLINEAQQADTNALRERMNPLRERIEKLTARRIELSENSGGIIGEIRGIFDDNWNPEALDAEVAKLQRFQADLAGQYQQASSQREDIFKAITQEAELEDRDNQLTEAELAAKNTGQVRVLAAANESFQFLGNAISMSTQVLNAQAGARAQFLADQDLPSLLKLEGDAVKNGGTVSANGIPISKAQITGARMNWEQIQRNEKASKLALQSNELQLAEQLTQHSISLMTPEQAIKVRDNGYVLPSGAKAAPQMVDAQIANGIQTRAAAIEAQTSQTGAGGLKNAFDTWQRTYKESSARLRSVAGSKFPGAYETFANETAQELKTMTEQLNAAKDPATRNAIATQWTQRINALTAKQNTMVDNVAVSVAGGDKNAAPFVAKYLRGQSFTQDESYQFAEYFSSKGELPVMMRTNLQAKTLMASYKSAEETVRNEIKAQGQSEKSLGASKFQTLVKAKFNKIAARNLNSQGFDAIGDSIPRAAKLINHPFQGVSNQSWQAALRNGDMAAAQKLSVGLGVTPEVAMGLIQGQGTTAQLEAAKKFAPQVSAAKYTGVLNGLDNAPEAQGMKVKPSAAFVDLVQDPKFHSFVGKWEDYMEKSTLGGAAAGAMNRGGLRQSMAGFAKGISIAQTQRQATLTAGGFLGSTRYQADAGYKMKAVLATIPGMNPDDAEMLLSGLNLQRGWDSQGADMIGTVAGVSGMGGGNTKMATGRYQAMENFLLNSKFDDPNLERIRKLAAPKLRTAAESLDMAIEKLSEGGE